MGTCSCREVHWSAELLHYAWHNRSKVEAMEAQLADFVGSAQKRRSLPAAPKQERHIMHQLASSYGLATQSFGSEPARHTDIFQVGLLCQKSLPCNAYAHPLHGVQVDEAAARWTPRSRPVSRQLLFSPYMVLPALQRLG